MSLAECLHLVFVSEHKLTSIIVYTIISNKVLVWVVHLIGDMENTTTIWGYWGEFLFCWPRRCQPDSMLFDVLGVNVGNLCLHWSLLSRLPSSGHCVLWTMHVSLVKINPPVHSTRFRITIGGSWRNHRLWWQHLAEGPSYLIKLTKCGLQSQLRDRKIRVRIATILSDEFYPEEGVPTGGVLAVTCFGLKINEFPSCIARDIFRALFVDDLVICFRGRSLDTIERHLQQAVDAIQECATRNGFKFAAQKCKVKHFTAALSRVHKPPAIRIGNTLCQWRSQQSSSGCGGTRAFPLRSTSVC